VAQLDEFSAREFLDQNPIQGFGHSGCVLPTLPAFDEAVIDANEGGVAVSAPWTADSFDRSRHLSDARVRPILPRKEHAMRVKEVMTPDVKCCSLETNLAAAAKIMWEADCGAVPVTDDRGTVVGMITDRDICIAGATRSPREGEIPVRDVISKMLHACVASDDVRTALETMKTQQVRRLPVLGQDGRLIGIVSIHDIARRARQSRDADIRPDDVLDTLIAITASSRRGVAVPA